MKTIIIITITLLIGSIAQADNKMLMMLQGMQQMDNYHHQYRMQRKLENAGHSLTGPSHYRQPQALPTQLPVCQNWNSACKIKRAQLIQQMQYSDY